MKRGDLSLTQHRQVVVFIASLGLMVGEVSLAGTPGEWTGTWYAPPVMASTLTFNDQTIREIVAGPRCDEDFLRTELRRLGADLVPRDRP